MTDDEPIMDPRVASLLSIYIGADEGSISQTEMSDMIMLALGDGDNAPSYRELILMLKSACLTATSLIHIIADDRDMGPGEALRRILRP